MMHVHPGVCTKTERRERLMSYRLPGLNSDVIVIHLVMLYQARLADASSTRKTTTLCRVIVNAGNWIRRT